MGFHRKKAMNMQEAEAFFRKYDGNAFFMAREEPEEALRFRSALLPRLYYNAWRKSILDAYCARITEKREKEDARSAISSYLSVLKSLKRGIFPYVKKYIALMEYAAKKSDPTQKIPILEDLAGRTAGRKDGGLRFLKRHTVLRRKARENLERALGKLTNIDPSELSKTPDAEKWKNRYEDALKAIKRR